VSNDSPGMKIINGKPFYLEEDVTYTPEHSKTPILAKIASFFENDRIYLTYSSPTGEVYTSVSPNTIKKLTEDNSVLNPGELTARAIEDIFEEQFSKEVEESVIEKKFELDQNSFMYYKNLKIGDHVIFRDNPGDYTGSWSGFGKTAVVTAINRKEEGFTAKIVDGGSYVNAWSNQIFRVLTPIKDDDKPATPKALPIYESGKVLFLDKQYVPLGFSSNLVKVNYYNAETDTYCVDFIKTSDLPKEALALAKDFLVPNGTIKSYVDGGQDMNYQPTTSSSSSKSTPSTSYNTKVYFKVYGGNILYPTYFNKDEMDKAMAKISYESETVDGQLSKVFTIKPEHTAWKKDTSKNPLMCAYDATSKFLDSILGVKIDSDDASWYKSHPLITTNGLPQEHTITVLNDLVSIYGIGIKKVYCRKGTSAFPETLKWQQVLGINPTAQMTRDASNEEFLSSLPEEAREFLNASSWDFEYVDELPKVPLVIMNGGSGSTTWAAGLGHASYSSPRGYKGNGWYIALSYDRIENCNRFVDPPTTAGTEGTNDILDISNCKDDEGNLIKTSVEKSYSWQNSSNSGYKSSEGGPQSGTPFQNSQKKNSAKKPSGMDTSTTTIDTALRYASGDIKRFKAAGGIGLSKKGAHPLMQGFTHFLKTLGLKKTDLTNCDLKYSSPQIRKIAAYFAENFCNAEFEYPYPNVEDGLMYLADCASSLPVGPNKEVLSYSEVYERFEDKVEKFLDFLIIDCGYLNTYAFLCAIYTKVKLIHPKSSKEDFTDEHYQLMLNDLWEALHPSDDTLY